MPQDKPLFQQHASRLFVAEGESYTSDPQTGLPHKPDEWHSGPQKDREHWNDAPCLVILGEPGSGKSREFQDWRDSLREAKQTAFLIALRDCFAPHLTLPQLAGDEEDTLSAALNEPHATPLILFLDALDEGRLHFPAVLQHLVSQLKTAQKIRTIRLRLSCRAHDWQSWEDKQALAKLYPDRDDRTGVTVIKILPLDSSAIRDLASEKLPDPARVNDFIGAAWEREVMALAGHPLTLGMMLEVFAADGKLGDNRTKLFQRACELLTQESNRLHGEKGKPLTTEADRLGFAKHLAALSVLSNQARIHIPDRDDPPSQSLDGTLVTGDKAKLHETLNCGLFTQGQPGSFRFLHPLLADFLAARWVAERIEAGLRPRAVLPLFSAGEAGIPTPLRNCAAWLACFNPEICQHLLRTDPATLMRGDVGLLSPQDRTALIQALADRYAQRDFQREVDSFADLADGVEAEVLKDLLKPSRSPAVRQWVLDMGISAKRKDIADEAWEIGANPQEDQTLRQRAVRLVCELAPAEYANQLVTLLDCPAEKDPNDSLAGIVLNWLYPSSLDTIQALTALREPRNENLSGVFTDFWETQFLSYLDELSEATVLDKLVVQLENSNGFRIGDPRPELFLNLLDRRLRRQAGDEISQIAKWISISQEIGTSQAHSAITDNPKLKQALLEYAISVHPPEQPYQVRQFPFPIECLKSDDFDWMIDVCNKSGLREDICNTIFWRLYGLYSWGNYLPTHRFDSLALLSQNYPCIKEDWERLLICDLDNEEYKFLMREARKKEAQQSAKAICLAELSAQIPRLKNGLAPEVLNAVNELKTFFGERPKLEALSTATSHEFSAAAEQGFYAVWNSPPSEATNWRHKQDSIDRIWLLATSYGLELTEATSPINWAKASDTQIEAASIIAIRYLDIMPDWFIRLYETHPDRFKPKLLEYLSRDTNLDINYPYSITATLLWAARTSPAIGGLLFEWFQTNPFPCNHRCLKHLVHLNIKRPSSEFSIFIEPQSRSALAKAHENPQEDIERASLLLATWWLLDWEPAYNCLEHHWFSDISSQFQRIREFVLNIKLLTYLDEREWLENIPFEANKALAPWLHLEACDQYKSDSYLNTREDFFPIARSSILRAMASGPAEPAREALQSFLTLPQFESEYQTIWHHLGEIERRMADERWVPPRPDEAKQVLTRSARMVRSEEEFYWLAEDICDTDLREVLRSDASLVPLLWKRNNQDQTETQQDKPKTKKPKAKPDTRIPDIEKPLQAILINQLFLLLKGTPLLHAREPESFDAKKEDCRLQVSFGNNQKALIAIEIKQAKHPQLWTAAKTQLVDKYMKEHNARFGLYLVGWYGADQPIVAMPGERKRKRFNTPINLEIALQRVVDQDLKGTDKRVRVIVYDCTV